MRALPTESAISSGEGLKTQGLEFPLTKALQTRLVRCGWTVILPCVLNTKRTDPSHTVRNLFCSKQRQLAPVLAEGATSKAVHGFPIAGVSASHIYPRHLRLVPGR